jgi:hypothetical protein
MSHFSNIKTKIKEAPYLIEALQTLNYEVKENQELVITNPSHAENHPVVLAEIALTNDIGFKWNSETETYELVAELDNWNLNVPVERFLQKVTQQYARAILDAAVTEEGFTIAEETVKVDNSIELVVTRWT